MLKNFRFVKFRVTTVGWIEYLLKLFLKFTVPLSITDPLRKYSGKYQREEPNQSDDILVITSNFHIFRIKFLLPDTYRYFRL